MCEPESHHSNDFKATKLSTKGSLMSSSLDENDFSAIDPGDEDKGEGGKKEGVESDSERMNKNYKAESFVKHITLPLNEWEAVFMNGKLLQSGLEDFCTTLKSHTPKRCIFIKRGHSINKKSVIIRFYCRHKRCKW